MHSGSCSGGVGYPPLVEMDDRQRREFHEALLDADSFQDLPGKWQAAILEAEGRGSPPRREWRLAASRPRIEWTQSSAGVNVVGSLDGVLPDKLRFLGPVLEPGFFKDRRHVGVGHQVPIALLVPLEEHPEPGVVIRVAEDVRALAPVVSALLSALGAERGPEAVEILDLHGGQDQLCPPSVGTCPAQYRAAEGGVG
jgi:hypothetical protein